MHLTVVLPLLLCDICTRTDVRGRGTTGSPVVLTAFPLAPAVVSRNMRGKGLPLLQSVDLLPDGNLKNIPSASSV